MASAHHRDRWQRTHRHVVDFDGLVLGAAQPLSRLDGWVRDLTGPPEGPLEDISGGAWRSYHFANEAEWPPCHVQQERRKFLLRAGGQIWLLKFIGLGREGADKLALAQDLYAAGFAPEPVGYRHGFLVERWMGEGRPLPLAAVNRAAVVDRLGAYVAFRASWQCAPKTGASLTELFRMARHNTASGLDQGVACAIDPWLSRLGRLESHVRRVRTDSRLHAWEWLRLPDGRLVKTDALDHHAAHDLIGCQDAAWDIAGAKVEFDLLPDEFDTLCEMFERVAQVAVSRELLAFYEVCYLAFQLGHWSLAAESLVGFPAEALRTRAAAERYGGKLRQVLQSP
jgi:hypothetical protein